LIGRPGRLEAGPRGWRTTRANDGDDERKRATAAAAAAFGGLERRRASSREWLAVCECGLELWL
jgi:hypothetical protein